MTATPHSAWPNYAPWWEQFLCLASTANWPVDPDDPLAYEEYYEEGLTPDEALSEDIHADAE